METFTSSSEGGLWKSTARQLATYLPYLGIERDSAAEIGAGVDQRGAQERDGLVEQSLQIGIGNLAQQTGQVTLRGQRGIDQCAAGRTPASRDWKPEQPTESRVLDQAAAQVRHINQPPIDLDQVGSDKRSIGYGRLSIVT